jgi:ABC-type transporter Mla subunit MlaD
VAGDRRPHYRGACYRRLTWGKAAVEDYEQEVAVPKLKDAKELTAPLEELTSQLKSELNDSRGDFDRLIQIADQLGEEADALAETFGSMNETLMARLEDVRGNTSSSSRRKAAATS